MSTLPQKHKPHKRTRVVLRAAKVVVLDLPKSVMAAELAASFTADLFAQGLSYGDVGFLLDIASQMNEDNQILAGSKGYEALSPASARNRVTRLIKAQMIRRIGRGKYWINPHFVWNRHGGPKVRKKNIKLWHMSA